MGRPLTARVFVAKRERRNQRPKKKQKQKRNAGVDPAGGHESREGEVGGGS